MSQWEERSRAVIAQAMADAATSGMDAKATITLIDERYPFGEREHHPYKVWLAVRRRALAALKVGAGDEVARPCLACGAASFRPCRPIGGEQLVGSHAARMEVR